jgi:hypothetical protein
VVGKLGIDDKPQCRIKGHRLLQVFYSQVDKDLLCHVESFIVEVIVSLSCQTGPAEVLVMLSLSKGSLSIVNAQIHSTQDSKKS